MKLTKISNVSIRGQENISSKEVESMGASQRLFSCQSKFDFVFSSILHLFEQMRDVSVTQCGWVVKGFADRSSLNIKSRKINTHPALVTDLCIIHPEQLLLSSSQSLSNSLKYQVNIKLQLHLLSLCLFPSYCTEKSKVSLC